MCSLELDWMTSFFAGILAATLDLKLKNLPNLLLDNLNIWKVNIFSQNKHFEFSVLVLFCSEFTISCFYLPDFVFSILVFFLFEPCFLFPGYVLFWIFPAYAYLIPLYEHYTPSLPLMMQWLTAYGCRVARNTHL